MAPLPRRPPARRQPRRRAHHLHLPTGAALARRRAQQRRLHQPPPRRLVRTHPPPGPPAHPLLANRLARNPRNGNANLHLHLPSNKPAAPAPRKDGEAMKLVIGDWDLTPELPPNPEVIVVASRA